MGDKAIPQLSYGILDLPKILLITFALLCTLPISLSHNAANRFG